MSGSVRKSGGISVTPRTLTLLVLKPCNLVELTCRIGCKATQSVVSCLEDSHARAGSSLKRSVTAKLLANSISTYRLIQGVSDEVTSMLWWPRTAVELYEVCSVNFCPAAAAERLRPLPHFDDQIWC